MEKFQSDSSCKKCGFTHANARFKAVGEKAIINNGSNQSAEFEHDVLIRACLRCGYEWLERPLDCEGNQ